MGWEKYMRGEIVCLLLCIYWMEFSRVNLQTEAAGTVYSIEAVQGGIANLPCDITPLGLEDKMQILIWYKDKSPIYTFDCRDERLDEGRHWSDELVLENRGFFRYQDNPAKLTLDNVRESDGGVYHCRVDFRQSPTRNVVVNLTIIIPPDKIEILNDRGNRLTHYVLGPYNEGSGLNITCVATGGRPAPKVSWWQENALLDNSYEYLSERRVRNTLCMDRLTRNNLHSVLTCQASNNNLIAPISTSVTLDMNLKPLSIKVLELNKPLSAGIAYELSCQVVGSRPAPTITWWKGNVQVTDTRETTSPDSNVTTSVLTFVPSPDDEGKYLSCKGKQPLISNNVLEDGWKLNVYYVPLVGLKLGSALNPNTIKVGDDVYFECSIKSNPWVYKVSWKHNGKTLYSNLSSGIIISNLTLVVQSVNRKKIGNYTCVATNQEGEAESNSVELDVKFGPVCKTEQKKVYNAAIQETALILCEVEANPTNAEFVWKFNNSDNSEPLMDIPQNLVSRDQTRSTLMYTPTTEQDYGTLLCTASNSAGVQKIPCVFYIIRAGRPDSLSNCSIENQTSDSLSVSCVEGYDGGLPQTFVMELYDAFTNKLISNVTTKNSYFLVGGLNPDQSFNIVLYSANTKGRSETIQMHTSTLKSIGKRSGELSNVITVLVSVSAFFYLTPILGILIGVVVALILVAIIIVVVIRLRSREESLDKVYDANTPSRSRSESPYGSNSVSKDTSTEPLRTNLNISANSLEEKNPDVIPHNNEDDYQEEERAFERLNNIQPRSYIRWQVSNAPGLEPNKNVFRPLYKEQQQTPCLQPFNHNHISNPQRMHHTHLIPAYISRTPRENQIYDGSISAATPLISRENNIMQTILVPNTDRSTPVGSSHSHTITKF